MDSILITGSNRGLGLGLIKHLIKSKSSPKTIIATCRNLDTSQELADIAHNHKNLHILQLDVREIHTFEKFAESVAKIVGDKGLNVLFNNAGCAPKSTGLGEVNSSQLMDTYAVNTVGPIMLTKALLPLLKKASSVNQNQPMSSKRAAVINMSSLLGSVSLNDNGGLYPYRCSKVALNMATKTLSIDLKNDGIIVTCIHPGWVKTDMGGPGAPLDVDTSVTGIIELLFKLSNEHNGEFYQYDGKQLAW